MENKNQPANPVLMQQIGDNVYRAATDRDPKQYNVPLAGLTKREYAAIKAMQGILANPNEEIVLSQFSVAQRAATMADELFTELEK